MFLHTFERPNGSLRGAFGINLFFRNRIHMLNGAHTPSSGKIFLIDTV